MQIPPLPPLPKAVRTDSPEQRQVRVDYILSLVEMGVPVCKAAEEGGVSYRTFKRWLNNSPDVLSQYEDAKLVIADKIKEVAGLCALRALDDPRYQTSLIFWLKCRDGWTETMAGGAQTMPSITFTTKEPKEA